ncbi:GNAT family N-acetyltransferase [Rubrivirga sp. S365]|uniref:GNAT family N-acetyltransferase n=1 Tax=Rubrivirga sp. S365 TaxID=3076080 RepID=UPI0028C82E33|nr:GNAT family N-acetyltransferase [Rubrivirga sp. S365]MDT7855757.1 GNAT family N-acetyltransferase [Rubrivirga sp. S365]
MPEIDLDDFQTTLRVRPLTPADHEAIVRLHDVAFPGMTTWTPEELAEIVAAFPEGQLGVEVDGRLVASSFSLVVDVDEYGAGHVYDDVAGDDLAENHDPDGDSLYGIEVVVDPTYRGMRIGRRLYEERKALVRRLNLKRIVIGGRLPGYHRVSDEMTAQEYVERVQARDLVEPVLTFQLANGFAIKRVVPGYLPDDAESEGYGVMMEWVNLHYAPDPAERTRSTFPVRVAAVQYPVRTIESFDDFARQVEFFVDAAAGYRADFVLFPEIFTLQLLSYLPRARRGAAVRQLAALAPDYLDLFHDLALKYNVNVIGGSTYAEEDDGVYNVAYLFRRDGSIEKQEKLHVTPNERRWWGVRPGSGVRVFDTDRGRVAISICYDVEFPEVARIAAAKGAQILFVPFCTDNRQGYLRVRLCAQARAIENQMYVVTAGVTGLIPDVDNMDVNYAQSGVFTPSDFPFARDGVAAECEPNVEALVIADVDLELTRRNRLVGTVRPWTDRRPDLYEIVEKTPTAPPPMPDPVRTDHVPTG